MNAITARPAAAWQILDEIFAVPRARPGAVRPIPMDFYESEKDYLVRASLPGFAKDQISIEIEGSTLTVSARREAASGPEGFEPLRAESLPNELARSVMMPEKIDADGATAASADGVLELRLPKLAPPRRLVKVE